MLIFAGVLIPCGLSALVMLKCMEHGRYLVVLAIGWLSSPTEGPISPGYF